jgi:uncharacterized membrane protein YgaE (UPF0421/DUF939 family)
MSTLRPSTRLALQASVAISIALFVAHLFSDGRAYWAIMTALLLISQTLGDSIKKSIARIGMTVIGGVIGTLLSILFASHAFAIFALLLLSLFFMAFYLEVSYAISMSFMTMFVVFLFASIHAWNLHMLAIRIDETLIGAGIAVVCAAFIFPIRAQQTLKQALPAFIETPKKTVKNAFHYLLTPKQQYDKNRAGALLKTFSSLHENIQSIRYETLFQSYSRQLSQQLFINLKILFYYVTSIDELAVTIKNNNALIVIQEELTRHAHILSVNFAHIESLLAKSTPKHRFQPLGELRAQIRDKTLESLKASTSQQSDWLKIYPFLYAARKTNDILWRIDQLLQPNEQSH